MVRPSSPTTEANCTAAARVWARESATCGADRRGISGSLRNERSCRIYCERSFRLLVERWEGSMRIRWLGWAGAEVEAQGERVIVDPLKDAAAVFAWLGERAAGMPVPEVTAAQPGAS